VLTTFPSTAIRLRRKRKLPCPKGIPWACRRAWALEAFSFAKCFQQKKITVPIRLPR